MIETKFIASEGRLLSGNFEVIHVQDSGLTVLYFFLVQFKTQWIIRVDLIFTFHMISTSSWTLMNHLSDATCQRNTFTRGK